ncbi:MAG: hypothetical protein AAF928_16760 [Myxococcota bacterium]
MKLTKPAMWLLSAALLILPGCSDDDDGSGSGSGSGSGNGNGSSSTATCCINGVFYDCNGDVDAATMCLDASGPPAACVEDGTC